MFKPSVTGALGVGLIALTIVAEGRVGPGSLARAGADDYVFGGACKDCAIDDTACFTPSPDCTADPANAGKYIKQIGQDRIAKRYCFEVGRGRPGTTTCNSSAPQDCIKKKSCTNRECTEGCTDIAPYRVDTVCATGTGGHFCYGR